MIQNWVEESLPSLKRAVGETNVFEFPKRMGAEDFSYMSGSCPAFLCGWDRETKQRESRRNRTRRRLILMKNAWL